MGGGMAAANMLDAPFDRLRERPSTGSGNGSSVGEPAEPAEAVISGHCPPAMPPAISA